MFPVRILKPKYKKIFATNLHIMEVTKDHLDEHFHLFRKNLEIFHPPTESTTQSETHEDLFLTAKSKSLSEHKLIEASA